MKWLCFPARAYDLYGSLLYSPLEQHLISVYIFIIMKIRVGTIQMLGLPIYGPFLPGIFVDSSRLRPFFDALFLHRRAKTWFGSWLGAFSFHFVQICLFRWAVLALWSLGSFWFIPNTEAFGESWGQTKLKAKLLSPSKWIPLRRLANARCLGYFEFHVLSRRH